MNPYKLKTDTSPNFARLFNHYSLHAKNRFRWSNLPTGIESRHIENFLFTHGQVFFTLDNSLGFICLPCSPNGSPNIYGDTLSFNVTGVGYSKLFTTTEGVRIIENDNLTPTIVHINHYSTLLDNIEKTQSLNLSQQKFPYIVATTQNSNLTHKNIMKKFDNDEMVIYVDKNLSDGGDIGVNVMKTDAPYLVDKLQSHKKDIQEELYTFLGINNTNTEKKERLLVDEVNVNNGQILMALDIGYKNRLDACDKINTLFNLNIKVEKVIDELSDIHKQPTPTPSPTPTPTED